MSDQDVEGLTCSAEPGCITCGDIAVALTVLAVEGTDAWCHDEQGRQELVATELVADLVPGDRVLVHAGVAIGRAEAEALTPAVSTATGG